MKSRFLLITISLGRCYSSLVQQDQKSKTDKELKSKIVESTQSSKPGESEFEENMVVGDLESVSARLHEHQDKRNPKVPPHTQTNSVTLRMVLCMRLL